MQAGGDDCDDQDATISPGTAETSDGRDEDCDGVIDEHLRSAGDVKITELLLRPATLAASEGQWVELLNTTQDSLSIAGWTLDVDRQTVAVNAEARDIAPGERLWLSTGTGAGVPNGLLLDGPLTATGTARVRLFAGDVLIDDLAEAQADSRGKSWQLDRWTDNEGETIEAWCTGTAPMTSGDLGTPRQPNTLCDSVDHDGDGYSVDDGDCDDTNPELHPKKVEVFNLFDDNCDGVVDDLNTGSDFTGILHVDVRAPTPQLGVGDFDGDGTPELVVDPATGYGNLWILSGDTLDGHVGTLAAFETSTTTATTNLWPAPQGRTAGPMRSCT